MPNMNALYLKIKKVMANFNFQKKVKGHGQCHMFKMYGILPSPKFAGSIFPRHL